MAIGVVAALVVLSALAAADHRPRAIASKPGALLGLRGGGGVHDDGVTKPLVVVGSLNVDITIEVERLPKKEETVMASSPCTSVAVGGKGANQAAAAARLATGTGRPAVLVCEFGNDGYAETMRTALQEAGVDVSRCAHSAELPTGQGIVMLTPDGAASSIVVPGANAGWTAERAAALEELVCGASAVLLQREIPEEVNLAVARAACAASVPVLQDVGGEDRPIDDELLREVAYVCPNETELERLTGMAIGSEAEILAAGRSLQSRGARNVLVTLGGDGSLLLEEGGRVVRQGALPIPGGRVVDATGAGDSFRAAFALALTEGQPHEQCMRFAAAAGAVAVAQRGALPSLPTRAQCEEVLGGAQHGGGAMGLRGGAAAAEDDEPFPLEFASRLNSMKDGAWRWEGDSAKGVLGWVARQGTVRGLGLLDFNYPQHLSELTHDEVRGALKAAGLKAGAVCMRYPKSMQAGGFTNADEGMRRQAIELTKEGCAWADALGATELVVWSAYDGYDYAHQADHVVMWQRVVDAFREVCDAYPHIKVSLEFKPTDENTRFFAVPSTGAALLLVEEIDRPNMGLTIDFGHCLAAGENPAQSAALVGSRGKLFGIQLNDGYTRLGAEDGLILGSVHPHMALEFVRWLQKTDFSGHVYFDTFPRNEDPVREAEYNIRKFKRLWRQAKQLQQAGIDELMARQDAMAVLEMLEAQGM